MSPINNSDTQPVAPVLPANMGGYTTKEVAELLGLTEDQVRHYVRRRLLKPDRGSRHEYRFNFQDVVLLRSAKGLLAANVSPRKANRVLLKLKKELNEVRSLASMRIVADGNAVVVREANQLWNAETGQAHLDFAVEELIDNVASLGSETDDSAVKSKGWQNKSSSELIVAKEADTLDSDEWYNLGLDLEEVDPKRAPEAYRRALDLDPKNADAHVKMGRLFQLKGDLKHAKKHYQLAMDALPSHQLANYNMGTVFDELDETEKAAEFYRLAPLVPDAHYNLSRICELLGDQVSALRHMREYRQLLDQV